MCIVQLSVIRVPCPTFLHQRRTYAIVYNRAINVCDAKKQKESEFTNIGLRYSQEKETRVSFVFSCLTHLSTACIYRTN